MADAREPEQGAGSQEPAQDRGSPAGEDLFDRWLAHRAEGEDTAPRPRTYGVPRTGVPRTEDETTAETAAEPPAQDAPEERTEEPSEPPVEVRGAPATSHETQSAPLDLDTGAERGEAVVDAPATEPSGKHPAAPATSTGLTDFEPVVLASVRRSEEQPAPTSRFGRRRRAESRAPAPADEAAPTDETPDETHADLPGATSAEVDREPRGEAPPPEPEVQPEPEPEPEAEPPAAPAPPASAAAEVFAAFNDTVAPADGPSSDDPADGPADTPATPERRRRPTRTPRPPRVRTGKGAAMGAGLARYAAGARELLDRSVRGAPEDRSAPAPAPPTSPPTSQPTSQPTSGPTSGHAPAARHETSRQASGQASGQEATTDRPQPTDPVGPAEGGARSTSAYDALRAQREAAVPPRPAVLPPDIDFRPRTLARQVTSLLLLVGIALTLLAAWRAYDSRVQTDIGFAAILALFTGIVWAVRAGSVPTRMSLHGGLLEVRTQAGRFLFELTSAYTHLEQVGTPGRPGWKVLVHRRGMHPFEITRGMVDPHEFLDAVRYYRPDL